MTLDWNPLLSVVAQSGAAFVAIIGGFLVARLIQMSSDRSASAAKIRSIEHKLSSVRELKQIDGQRIIVFHVAEILSRIFSQLDHNVREEVVDSILTGPAVQSYLKDAQLIQAEMRECVDDIVQRIRLALLDSIRDLETQAKQGTLPFTVQEARSDDIKKPLEDKIYVEVFCRIRGYGTVLGCTPEIVRHHLITGCPPEWHITSNEEYLAVARKWRERTHECRILQTRLESERANLTTSGKLVGAKLVIALLAYTTIVTVITPVLYMAHSPAVDLRARLFAWLPGVSHLTLLVFLLASAFTIFLVGMTVSLRRLSQTTEHVTPTAPAPEATSAVELPERDGAYPEPSDGQMQNIYLAYLHNHDASDITFTPVDSRHRVNFTRNGQQCEFEDASELDALKRAYESLFSYKNA